MISFVKLCHTSRFAYEFQKKILGIIFLVSKANLFENFNPFLAVKKNYFTKTKQIN